MPNQRQNQEHLYNQAPKEVAIASSIIPYPRDDYKALFLGYRACGLSPMEAMKIIGITKGAVSQWRHNDPVFASLEQRLPEIRKELSKEYIEIEFFRNFRLALEQDYRILRKALDPERDAEGNVIPMTRQEHDYLVKLRSQYSPQQLQILEAIVSGTGDGFNFALWVAEHPEVIQVSRTDTVTVKR